MASLSLAALLLAVCCSFVSSGILPGSIRGYQQSFASRQYQSYDSRSGYNSGFSVKARQCSVIRRYTRHEKVNLPFLCHVLSGRVVPLPPHVDSNQVLNAMQAGGWTMCYKTIGVPIYQVQRIPVCCPGTTPIANGGCQYRTTTAQYGNMAGQGQQQQDPRMTYPGYRYTPPGNRSPVLVQAPRPYRGMLSRLSTQGVRPGGLIQRVMMSKGRAGPAYTTDNRGNTVPQVGGRTVPGRLRPGMTRRPATTEYQKEIARYLAAMMYQKLLLEQQQQTLQEEINRQYMLSRQQMEFYLAQQRRLALHLQNQRQPTDSPQSPNTDPSPIPPPPIKAVPTTPFPEQGTSAPQMVSTQGDAQVGQDTENPLWSGGILDRMPHLREPTSPTNRDQMFGNGPTNMPPGTQTLRTQMHEMKKLVKKIFDDCLAQSDITTPMNEIVRSGDFDMLRPVCMSSETVGPCVMEKAKESLTQDRMGMMGRRMIQSLLMSLGQMCMRLERAGQMADPNGGEMTSPPVFPNPNGGGMTSPPVFPNPAPSITNTAVTEGTVENTEGISPSMMQTTDVVDEVHNEHTNRPEGKTTSNPMEEPAATHSPNVQEEELELAEAAFPMWLILAMVGACATLLLVCCLTVCLVLRCRRKKKSVELDREPEKLPVPAEGNVYAATPCVPPPAYHTTAVRQTVGGDEPEETPDQEFKIPEDDVHKEAKEEKGKEDQQ